MLYWYFSGFKKVIRFHLRHYFYETIHKSQDDEINVDLRTSGFDNEALSVDACAVNSAVNSQFL